MCKTVNCKDINTRIDGNVQNSLFRILGVYFLIFLADTLVFILVLYTEKENAYLLVYSEKTLYISIFNM